MVQTRFIRIKNKLGLAEIATMVAVKLITRRTSYLSGANQKYPCDG